MSIRALYVHAPFCARRCGYCDFAVTVAASPDPSVWARVIGEELRTVVDREELAAPLRPRSLYVGGGTPSLFGPDAMSALAEALTPLVDLSAVREWTAEANPESFDGAVARGWVEAGVDRLSLGAQTFDDRVLRWMGRLHGPDGPRRAMAAAREAGLDNVSIDLIFGLPTGLGRDWSADLDAALSLEPEHLSLYGLTAEPATPLGRRVAEGKERMPDAEHYAAEYLAAAGRLRSAGWEHYEVSNFCLAGRASAHNEAYWDGSAYLGLGSGAHSYLAPRRWWNLRDWRAYRSAVEAGRSPVDAEEHLDPAARSLERTWLGLRTRSGVGVSSETARAIVSSWVADGLAEWAGPPEEPAGERRRPVARLTARGWLVLDRLALDLDGAAGELDPAARAAAHT